MGSDTTSRCYCCQMNFYAGGLPSAYCESCRRKVAERGAAVMRLELENERLKAELEEWRDLVRRASVAFARSNRTLEPQGDPT